MKYKIIFIFAIISFTACTNKSEKKEETNQASAVKYDSAVVERGGVSTIIRLPAQLAAYQEVSIFPKVNGYVKDILVDIGSKVSKGSLLMVLQAPELEQAVLQAKERYAKANADYLIDKERSERLQEAAKTAGAISPIDISTAKAKMEADMALSNAEKANWQMQQTMMSYLRVTAPFDGVITERNVSTGALVNATDKTKPMLELKQVEHLRLQVDIPEAVASTLKNGDSISFYVNAFQGRKMTGIVARKSNNVNAQFRTERIEIDVMNKDGNLVPGMFADVQLKSSGDANAMFVPKSAVVTSTERKYVLLLKDGKVKKVDVSTGNASADKIEIYGNLQVGDKVIAVANDEIKER